MKKVLVLSLTHGRGYGAERVLEYLMIAGKDTLSKQLMIASPRGSAVAEKAAELSYAWLPWESARDSFFQNLAAFFKLSRREEIKEVEIFHGWTSRAFEWVILLSLLKDGSAMGSVHESPVAYFHRFFRRKLIGLGMSRLQKCVYVSQALMDLCGGYSEECLIIRNGLPDLKTAPRNPDGVVKVGFLGVNALGKGVEVLERVITGMKDEPVQWHLFGQPSEETEEIIRRIGGRELADRVVIHGFKSSSQIYGDLDIVFHPSTAFDAFPTVLIESARAGRPVVASRLGGVEEITVHGKTGLLYEPGDEKEAIRLLGELVRDRDMRELLGRQARLHFEAAFGVDEMVKKYISLWTGAGSHGL